MMSSEEVIKPMLWSLIGFKVHSLMRWERRGGQRQNQGKEDWRSNLSSIWSRCY